MTDATHTADTSDQPKKNEGPEETVRIARAKAALDDELARWLLEAQRAAAKELGEGDKPKRPRYRGKR